LCFSVLEDLVEHFKQFGEISKITLKIPIAFNRQAFAFILFKDSKAVSKVCI
jgi:RNA recognition motif-containing protein